ncbi:MAG: glycosyl hydrolase family 18 protein, partial [Actinomycetota bacterium]
MSPRSKGRFPGPVRALALALVAVLGSSACQPNRFVSGWIPYWNSTSGTGAINDANASTLFGEVSLFWYGTRTDGSIGLNGTAGTLTTTVNALRAKGLPVVPTIADGTAAPTMSNIIANGTTRANHVQNIVNLVVNNGYDGIDIDYEVFAFSQVAQWNTIKPNWVTFVNDLANALHQRGKLLSVTVPAVWNLGNSGYKVYAQDQIAGAVDRLRLMVYDWSVGTAGPIAPLGWVQQVIDYSSSVVPVSKLQLGVPAYGRHWATKVNPNDVCPAGSTFTDAITMSEVAPLAAAHGVTPTRDISGELTFSWVEGSIGEQVVTSAPPTIAPPSNTAPSLGQPADGSPVLAKRVRPSATAVCP